MRLGGGDYARAGEAVENAQYRFLEALVLYAPEVVESLLRTCRVEDLQLTVVQWAESPPRWQGTLPPDLLLWAEKYHLTDPWCLDFAIDTLRAEHAAYHPYLVEITVFLDADLHPHKTQAFSFELSPPGFAAPGPTTGWNPARERRGEAKKRIEEAFAEQLEAYLDRMEELAKARGLGPTKGKRGEPGEDRKHFRWLARYQCEEQTFEEIGASEGCSRQSVSEAVHDLAALTGLTLRPARRGRKQGPRDRTPRMNIVRQKPQPSLTPLGGSPRPAVPENRRLGQWFRILRFFGSATALT